MQQINNPNSLKNLILGFLSIFIFTSYTSAQEVVANDNFADAEILIAEGSLLSTNVGASKETGEPQHAGNSGGASVWYQWTAATDGYFTVNTFGSDFDTTLAMYSGLTLDALSEVASNDDSVTLQSELKDIFVFAGTTYHIAVDGYFGAIGQITLSWSFLDGTDTTPPIVTINNPDNGASFFQGASVLADYVCSDETLGSGIASCIGDVSIGEAIDTQTLGAQTFTVTAIDNSGNTTVVAVDYTIESFSNDDFTNAEVLAERGKLIRANFDASKESGEPDHAGNAGGASVWFQWTADSDGTLSIETFFSDFDTTLAIYTGLSVDTLTEVVSNDNALGSLQSELVDVPVTLGTTYFIAVDGFDGASGQIDLDWSFFNGPTFTEVTPQTDPLWVTDADHDFWLNAAAPADIDGDGDLDLAVIGFFVEYGVSAEDRLVVFINEGANTNGEWTFTQQEVALVDLYAGSSDLAWGDLDNDGDPDLAVASEGVTTIFRNDEGVLNRINADLPGYYEDSGYTNAYDLRSVTWADYDNDGDLDLLIPSIFDFDSFTFRTMLMRNDGSDGSGGWLFTDSGVLLDNTVHAQTAWGDKDGDGDLDLFMANIDNFTGDSFIRTYQNDGGSFVSEQPLGSLSIEYGLADWVDYDQDGDLDILVVGLVQETDGSYNTVLRIYNYTDGVFLPDTIIQSDFFPWLDLHAATWADYDSDGDVDILVTGSGIGESDIVGRSEIYINDGGEFYPLGRDLPAPISSVGRGGSFTWFDVDGDGDLDYFVAGAYFVPGGNGLVEAQMHLYLNDAIEPNTAPEAPQALSASTEGNQVTLSWDAAFDDHTLSPALTYDLVVRPISTETESSIQRRLPEPGNVGAVTSWGLRGLSDGDYSWSIQAVDSSFNGSAIADGNFNINSINPINGTVSGVRGGSARCRNFATGQGANTLIRNSSWDCTNAGLNTSVGERVQVNLSTRALNDDPITGTVTGFQLNGGRCLNLTTNANVLLSIDGLSWNCSSLATTANESLRVILNGRTNP